MVSSASTFARRTVASVMSTPANTLSWRQSLESAVARLQKAGLSAAPVVDDTQHCVGMFSLVDFLRYHVALRREAADNTRPDEAQLRKDSPEAIFHIEVRPDRCVEDYMTSGVQTINGESSLTLAAKAMTAEGIHHLPVTDAKGHVMGMVSSLDILRVVAETAESLTN